MTLFSYLAPISISSAVFMSTMRPAGRYFNLPTRLPLLTVNTELPTNFVRKFVEGQDYEVLVRRLKKEILPLY